MRTGRERLREDLWDFYIESVEPGAKIANLIAQYADNIMEDINLGIITAEVDG